MRYKLLSVLLYTHFFKNPSYFEKLNIVLKIYYSLFTVTTPLRVSTIKFTYLKRIRLFINIINIA